MAIHPFRILLTDQAAHRLKRGLARGVQLFQTRIQQGLGIACPHPACRHNFKPTAGLFHQLAQSGYSLQRRGRAPGGEHPVKTQIRQFIQPRKTWKSRWKTALAGPITFLIAAQAA